MSYLFNGSTDYMDRAASIPVSDTPFTVGLWVSPAGGAETIFDLNDGALGAVENNAYELDLVVVAGGNFKPRATVLYQGAFLTAVPSVAVADSQWAAGTSVWRDHSNRSAYVNGGNRGDQGPQSAIPNTLTTLTLGRERGSQSEYLNGYLGYVFIWNVALSDSDILSWYGGAIPQPSALQAVYDLTTDHGSSTIPDRTGNGYDLTIHGTPAFNANNPPVNYYPAAGATVLPPRSVSPQLGM